MLRRTLIGVLLSIILVAGARGQESATGNEGSKIPDTESELVKHPLRPPDTSSPRATLQGFLDNMNHAHRVLMAAHEENSKTRGFLTSQSTKLMAKEAERLLRRGVYCLDLSRIPVSLRKRVGVESALELKDILDRITLPPDHSIPDAEALEEGVGEGLSGNHDWRIPDTDIVIARVEEGPRQGEYLFTPRTVARLGEFYAAAKSLPYKTGVYTSDGFYEFCARTPGSLLPPRWSQWLPTWSNRNVLSLTLWQWFAWGLALVLWVSLIVAAYRQLVERSSSLQPGGRYWARVLFCLVSSVSLGIVSVILSDQINLRGPVFMTTRLIFTPIWWLFIGAMIFFIWRALAEMIIASPKIDPEGIQASYFRALFSVLGFVGGGVAVIVGLSRIGVSLVPLLTGLGIGGLAVALAARPTLEGVIGSFTVFADNPYRVGERLSVMGHIGKVESIGLRSTRIRLLSGHVTVIPNDKMAAAEIENIGRRPHIRRIFSVTIPYGTPPEKINRAVAILREILAVPPDGGPEPGEAHPNEAINKPEFEPRVYFNELNNDSLNIYVSYWYHPPEWWDYMEHAHWVNVQIMERFNAEAIQFAFPTQTVHLAGDKTSGHS